MVYLQLRRQKSRQDIKIEPEKKRETEQHLISSSWSAQFQIYEIMLHPQHLNESTQLQKLDWEAQIYQLQGRRVECDWRTITWWEKSVDWQIIPSASKGAPRFSQALSLRSLSWNGNYDSRAWIPPWLQRQGWWICKRKMSFQFLVGYCGDSEIHFVRFVSSFTLGSLILSLSLFSMGSAFWRLLLCEDDDENFQ